MAVAQPTTTLPPENQDVETRDDPQVQDDTVAEETQSGGEQAAATPPVPPAIDLTDPKQRAAYDKAYGEGLMHRSQEMQALREKAEQYQRMEALAANDPSLYNAIQTAVQRRMAGLPPAAPVAPQPQKAADSAEPETEDQLLEAAEVEYDAKKAARLRKRAFEMVADRKTAAVRDQVRLEYEPEVQERKQEKTATEWQREEARLTNLGLNLKDPATMAKTNQKLETARQVLIQRFALKLRAAGLDPSAALKMSLSPREIVNEAFIDELPQLAARQVQAKATNGRREHARRLGEAQTEGEGASMGIANTPVRTGRIPYEDIKERSFAAAGD